MREVSGFTLSELLIVLGILGVIAAFTIPKVLQAQQGPAWSAQAKEAMEMMASAYDGFNIESTPTSATGFDDLTPYFNYVAVDTVSQIDHVPGLQFLNCSDVNQECYRLHNGGIILSNSANTFGQAQNNHYIFMYYDPDGEYCGSTTCNSKSVVFMLFFDGRITTSSERQAGEITYTGPTPRAWGPDALPAWFSWE